MNARILLLAIILTACSTTTEPPPSSPSPTEAAAETETLSGTVVLEQAVPVAVGDPCSGQDEHAALTEDAQVVVTNETGTTLAVGRLQAGVAIETRPGFLPWCRFEFTVDVPPAEIYTVAIANTDELTFTSEELEDRGWAIEATIG